MPLLHRKIEGLHRRFLRHSLAEVLRGTTFAEALRCGHYSLVLVLENLGRLVQKFRTSFLLK
jgi:hypothetical protein